MVTRVFPMWPSPERLITFSEVLRLVGDNEWDWTILDLNGTGPLPHGMSWDQLDEHVEATPYVVDWPGLVEFADSVVQVTDAVVVATLEGEEVARIEAFDSSEWTVCVDAVGDLDDRITCLLHGAS